MLNTRAEILSELLDGTAEALDIPRPLHDAAILAYLDVGNWLADYADPGGEGWRIYSQGSFRLGTVVRIEGSDEYDLDAVCLRSVPRHRIDPIMLKAGVGDALDRYIITQADEQHGPSRCEERKRCWTLLDYPEAFHLDVLPAIPSDDGSPTGISITDKKLHGWHYSDPIAYAEWFKNQMKREFIQKRLRLAEAARTPPERVPESAVKTTLQRVVQILKVHRNQYFAEDLDQRPSSILLTTLAANIYQGERDLLRAVQETVELLPTHIAREDGLWIVSNPVEPRENFADKWNDEPERAEHFFEWLAKLNDDIHDAGETEGLHRIVERLAESFGPEPIEKAAGRLADRYRDEREHGSLRFAGATGALSAVGAIPVKNHDFYGTNAR